MAPRILALLLVVSAVAYMDRQILAILIEPIKHELNLSDTLAGLLYGFTFAAFFALLGVPIAQAHASRQPLAHHRPIAGAVQHDDRALWHCR